MDSRYLNRCIDIDVQNVNDAEDGACGSQYSGNIQLATGSNRDKCLGSGAFRAKELVLPKSGHVPNLHNPFISVGQVCDQGNMVIFSKNEAVVLIEKSFSTDTELGANDERNNSTGMYEFNRTSMSALGANSILNDITLWNNRLIHVSAKTIRHFTNTQNMC